MLSYYVNSLAISYVQSIVMELGDTYENPLHAKIGIMVIHYVNPIYVY